MINWLAEAKKREDEIVESLSGWIQKKSVYDEDTISEDAPFGQGVSDAFEFILDKAKADGFETVDDEGYACHIDYGDGEEIVGILGHVDVVPEGDGWKYPPYSGEVVDNYIYGRGTQDDKGPVMASYFAMKIIQDLELPVSKKVRMILGGNEERDWQCVDHYFKNYPRPNIGFTPDGDFPLVYAEKEIQMYEFVGTYKNDEVISFESGTAANSVPDHAAATVKLPLEQLNEKFNLYLKEQKLNGSIKADGGNTILEIEGVSAHGSTPEEGVNAAVHLLTFLAANTNDEMIQHFSKVFAFNDGEGLGIKFSGDKMGALTANLGVVKYQDGAYSFVLDTRYPMEIDRDKMKLSVYRSGEVNSWGGKVEQVGFKKGIYLDLESDLIKTLMKAYVDQTGDTETKPYVIGGGSFARATDNVACFGMLFPQSTTLFHQKNEAVNIDELILATAIYAQAIYDLAK